MKHVLLLVILAFALAGCGPGRPSYVDVPTRVYACPRGANPGPMCKGELVYVGNMYVRVDEDAARIQIHAQPLGDTGLLSTATIQFRDCKIQDRLNWSCNEGASMTSYYLYTMKDGILHASWSSPVNEHKIPVVAIAGAMRWVYRFGVKTPGVDLLTHYR
jgi:hypothetical protein